MKAKKLVFILAAVLLVTIPSMAKVSSMQLMFLVKQAFPEATEVNVFVNSDNLSDEVSTITRAANQLKVKANVYEIQNASNIGSSMQQVDDKSILMVFDNNLFNNSKNKLYILSKCKEKQISLVTSSNDFIQSGALLGYIEDAGQKKIVLNLTHYDHLKAKFTSEMITQIGVSQVIPPDYLSSN